MGFQTRAFQTVFNFHRYIKGLAASISRLGTPLDVSPLCSSYAVGFCVHFWCELG